MFSKVSEILSDNQAIVCETKMTTISGFHSAVSGIHRGMDAVRRDAQVIATKEISGSVSDKEVTKALVDLKSSSLQVEASVKALSVQNDVLGSLLDEMA